MRRFLTPRRLLVTATLFVAVGCAYGVAYVAFRERAATVEGVATFKYPGATRFLAVSDEGNQTVDGMRSACFPPESFSDHDDARRWAYRSSTPWTHVWRVFALAERVELALGDTSSELRAGSATSGHVDLFSDADREPLDPAALIDSLTDGLDPEEDADDR